MYMIESMIEMGLKEGQKWPSKAHRNVAVNLAICNPRITTRDALNAIVQKVCAIPKNEIKTITVGELPKYGINLAAA